MEDLMAKDKDKGKVTEDTNQAVKASEAEAPKTSDGRGKKIKLPNGEYRQDFIHRRYYDDGGEEHTVKRGDIARELTEMTGKVVAYQIVFAATKTPTKPVPKVRTKPPVTEADSKDKSTEAAA